MADYDVCIIGSGAGAAPVALTLSQAGKKVVILEKGPWLTEKHFAKDEMACCRRSIFTPNLQDEQHVIEEHSDSGWQSTPTAESGWDFWNGNVVGGSSNFMSGFFYRYKPVDFNLRSEFGPIKNANIVDWPIAYSDLEPYYTKVEREVGISGRVTPHPFAEPRSTADFPYPPTAEHFLSGVFDKACDKLKLHSLPIPRAILSRPDMNRNSCEYSGYCGSYGCTSGAKGSARAALLNRAVATGNCEILPRSHVNQILTGVKGNAFAARYIDQYGQTQIVNAHIFVVACQAIETSRLLLRSPGPQHEYGLGNRYNQVGKNLIFSAGGSGRGTFYYDQYTHEEAQALKQIGVFVNRGLQDWYVIRDHTFSRKNLKGGTIDFLLRHPNPMNRAMRLKRDEDDNLVYGSVLKQQLKQHFTSAQYLDFEVFNDWLPTDDCYVTLDKTTKDKWDMPVAKIRLNSHPHDLKVGQYLTDQARRVLKAMGAKDITGSTTTSPPANLVAGGCRFGNDPKTSVLDPQCRVHGTDNVYVTDGSWIPTGGSVPYTWTIYANSFRVADIIRNTL